MRHCAQPEAPCLRVGATLVVSLRLWSDPVAILIEPATGLAAYPKDPDRFHCSAAATENPAAAAGRRAGWVHPRHRPPMGAFLLMFREGGFPETGSFDAL